MGWSPTVAHASGSERFVLFPWLISASAYSSFREIPCPSVANAYSSFRVIPCHSVSFRGKCLFFIPCHSVANASAFQHQRIYIRRSIGIKANHPSRIRLRKTFIHLDRHIQRIDGYTFLVHQDSISAIIYSCLVHS